MAGQGRPFKNLFFKIKFIAKVKILIYLFNKFKWFYEIGNVVMLIVLSEFFKNIGIYYEWIFVYEY